ncbi:hypothetical protein QWZ10_19605 [Paracoccus cavernae]|uniref:Uncharacterized protein n=1 Tax=Paracoccus cavernae TaxID=1571207 RepID=A0ABT8DAU5_9RHOB|nr:hypothetical protein [Paracoccus cavernae]
MAIETIRSMADEVAGLMASRFGGAKRGQSTDLTTMLRRRGGALPRNIRRKAHYLAEADRMVDMPKLGKQIDLDRADRSYRKLVAYLKPVGKGARWQNRAINLGASLALALLVIGGIALWMHLRRGAL